MSSQNEAFHVPPLSQINCSFCQIIELCLQLFYSTHEDFYILELFIYKLVSQYNGKFSGVLKMPFQIWISQFLTEDLVSSKCTINVNLIVFNLTDLN